MSNLFVVNPLIFRFIDTGVNNGFFNMAVDEAVMHSVRMGAALPTIRFYQWEPACLSVGYFQSLSDVNVDRCRELNIDVIRRLTGGKAVLHDMELTYSIIVPQGLMPRSIMESYGVIAEPVLETLRMLGLAAELRSGGDDESGRCRGVPPARHRGLSSACFCDTSRYEISVNGRKIVGSAQARMKNVFLQHGSILLDCDPVTACSVFDIGVGGVNADDFAKRVTSIRGEGKGDVDIPAIKSTLISAFMRSLDVEVVHEPLGDDELLYAAELEKRYRV